MKYKEVQGHLCNRFFTHSRSLLRQGANFFQTSSNKACNSAFPLSTYSIYSFPQVHAVAAYVFFLIFLTICPFTYIYIYTLAQTHIYICVCVCVCALYTYIYIYNIYIYIARYPGKREEMIGQEGEEEVTSSYCIYKTYL